MALHNGSLHCEATTGFLGNALDGFLSCMVFARHHGMVATGSFLHREEKDKVIAMASNDVIRLQPPGATPAWACVRGARGRSSTMCTPPWPQTCVGARTVPLASIKASQTKGAVVLLPKAPLMWVDQPCIAFMPDNINHAAFLHLYREVARLVRWEGGSLAAQAVPPGRPPAHGHRHR
jgi:hypothetical protein